MMKIDVHTHGLDADKNENGRPCLPIRPRWQGTKDPAAHIGQCRKAGIERIMVLEPPEIAFYLEKVFGNFVIPLPMVSMDRITPETIQSILDCGARGIKFIGPEKSYGDESYFPLYRVLAENHALAMFHTGFLTNSIFEPGDIFGRQSFTDITRMRPAALDRIARAFPTLKILMAHFGNPWWEEAWKVVASHRNIYAEMSGGTAFRRDMGMWKMIFAPNGILDADVVGKLCFGTDTAPFGAEPYGEESAQGVIRFYDQLYEELKLSMELRRRINRENILSLLSLT